MYLDQASKPVSPDQNADYFIFLLLISKESSMEKQKELL